MSHNTISHILFSFNSGKMPRTAGGTINPQRAAGPYFSQAKERDEGDCCHSILYI